MAAWRSNAFSNTEEYKGARFVSVIRTYVEEVRFDSRSSTTKLRQMSKSIMMSSLPRIAIRVGLEDMAKLVLAAAFARFQCGICRRGVGDSIAE